MEVIDGSNVPDDSKTFLISNDKLTTACFSDSSKTIVCGSQKGIGVIWDIETYEEQFRIECPEKNITCCALSLREKTVMFSANKKIYIYDKENGEFLANLINKDNNIVALHVVPIPGQDSSDDDCSSEEEEMIAVCDKTLLIWNWGEQKIDSGKRVIINPKSTLMEKLEGGTYICSTVTEDGTYLIVGTSDRYINIWNVNMRKKVKEFNQRSPGLVTFLDTYLSEESNLNTYTLLSVSNDKSVKQWKMGLLENQDQQVKLSSNFSTHWRVSDTSLTAAINHDGKINIYNNQLLISQIKDLDNAKYVRFSSDGNEIAIGFSDGRVIISDYRSKSFKPIMKLDSTITYLEYVQHFDSVILVASSDEGCLQISESEKSVRFLSPSDQLSSTIKCFMLHFAKCLLTVDREGRVKLWKLDGMNDILIGSIGIEGVRAIAVAITPRQDKIAITYTNGTFKIYHIVHELHENSCRVWCKFYGDKKSDSEGNFSSCCFSNDGKLLAVGKESGDIVVRIMNGFRLECELM